MAGASPSPPPPTHTARAPKSPRLSLRPRATRVPSIAVLCLVIIATCALFVGSRGDPVPQSIPSWQPGDGEAEVYESIGVNWGRVSQNPIQPEIVVGIMQRNNITRVKLFQPNYVLLYALKNTGIKVMIGTSLKRMQRIAKRKEYSDHFVITKILPWVKANVTVDYIMLGNEPFLHGFGYAKEVVDSLDNMRSSLDLHPETQHIKLGVPLSDPTEENFPVSAGIVKSAGTGAFTEIAKRAVLTRSMLFINFYPFFSTTLKNDGTIYSINASLGVPGMYPEDAPASKRYPDLLSAQHDSAIEGFGRLGFGDVDIAITETGWPTEGGRKDATNAASAEIFYKFLYKWALSGNGTKLRPNRTILTYAFGLFDEDMKGTMIERSWGLFTPLGIPKFNFSLLPHHRISVPYNFSARGTLSSATLDLASLQRGMGEGGETLLANVTLTNVVLLEASVDCPCLFSTATRGAVLRGSLWNVTLFEAGKSNVASVKDGDLLALNFSRMEMHYALTLNASVDGAIVGVPQGSRKWVTPVLPPNCAPDNANCPAVYTCEHLPETGSARGWVFFQVVLALYLLPQSVSFFLFPLCGFRQFLDQCPHHRTLIKWLVFAGQPVHYFGRYLYESFYATMGYTLFWLAVLVVKVFFSYYIEIYPMMLSARTAVNNPRDYLYEFPSSTAGAQIMDLGKHVSNTWSLTVVMVILWLPIFVVFLIDLHMFYMFVGAIFGVVAGFFRKLGLVRSFATVKQKFFMFPNLLFETIYTEPDGRRRGSIARTGDLGAFGSMQPPDSPPTPVDSGEGHRHSADQELDQDPLLRRPQTMSRLQSWSRIVSQPPFGIQSEAVSEPRFYFSPGSPSDSPSLRRASTMPQRKLADPLTGGATFRYRSGAPSPGGVGSLVSAVPEFTDGSLLQTAVFVHMWNEFVASLREEDLISDREKVLMLAGMWQNPMQDSEGDQEESTVLQWPLFLLAGSTQEIVRLLENYRGDSDEAVWQLLRENKRMEATIRDCYNIFPELLRYCIAREEENRACNALWRIIKTATEGKRFLCNFSIQFLSKTLAMVADVAKTMAEARADDSKSTAQLGDQLGKLYKLVTRQFLDRDSQYRAEVDQIWLPPDAFSERAFLLLPAGELEFRAQANRLHSLLTLDLSCGAVPTNEECRRRMVFFYGSLFMTFPRAPEVRKMIPFSTLTPYYAEDVIYDQDKLTKKNTENVSTLFYLTLYYPDEWKNFLQRVGCKDESGAWFKVPMELRLWASHRSQTLARTVRGMMYYNRALALLDFLETASTKELKEKGWEDEEVRAAHFDIAALKYTYVVTCQTYGEFKRRGDPRSEEVLYLLTQNKALRVAYVDEEMVDGVVHYYSCLVKSDRGREQLIYRIRLPGPMKVGEGKPENQNHAIIFTRGEGLQVIDMNQDNYLEESYKIRNLLEEFNRPEAPRILGMREHVFTGSGASVAKFMFSEEITNVTLWFRVLALLRVRLHYGHPDVFDRIWHLPRGGVSKASPIIHVVEDVYGGMSSTLRGAQVTHHEYIQVGKGRDVGLFQITQFYAKIINGQGEETLSREVHRIATHADFFRLLSFYFSHLGLPISYVLILTNQFAIFYLYLLSVFSGLENDLLDLLADTQGKTGAIASTVQLVLFIATTVFQPVWLNWILEMGFLQATMSYMGMTLLLSPVYFTFLLGTRVYNFTRAIRFGGSKYRATGRNFVIEHEPFDENFRRYSSSHYAIAVELSVLLLISAMYGDPLIILKFLTSFLIICFLFAPAIFNPSGFEWAGTVKDYKTWTLWMTRRGSIGIDPKVSWESWWLEEQQELQKGGFFARMTTIVLASRFFLLQFAITYGLDSSSKLFGDPKKDHAFSIYCYIWVLIGLTGFALWLQNKLRQIYAVKYQQLFRIFKTLVGIVLAGLLGGIIWKGGLSFKDVVGISLAMISTGWGLIKVGQALRPTLDGLGVPPALWWPIVQNLAWLYDATLGFLLFVPITILSWFTFFSSLQDRLLYNTAFSGGLAASRIVATSSSNTA